MEIPEPVRRQALHPFRKLPLPPGWNRVEGEHVMACLHNVPIATVIEPQALEPGDVAVAVDEARALVRAHGRSLLIWWVVPEYAWLGDHLTRLGLVNDDTPGFESVENAMALVEPPPGDVPDDVTVTQVESFEDFALASRVSADVFGFSDDMRESMEAELPARYEEYVIPGNPGRTFNAVIDSRVVGTATAVIGDAGVNLFAGSVLEDARGRGVYRALIQARWDLAVERGTPALTVQAGRMSRPIVERLGFRFIESVRIYVDDFS